MSAHKIHYKHQIILDLTNEHLNIDTVNSKLKKTKIYNSHSLKSGIKIGKYFIFLSTQYSPDSNKLISINDLINSNNLNVNIKENINGRFRIIKANLMENEPWFGKYINYSFSLKEISDAIFFCNRLETLDSFS